MKSCCLYEELDQKRAKKETEKEIPGESWGFQSSVSSGILRIGGIKERGKREEGRGKLEG